MTSILLRLRREGEHDRVQVFAGPDEFHRALCGDLMMRQQEAAAFVYRMLGRETRGVQVQHERAEGTERHPIDWPRE